MNQEKSAPWQIYPRPQMRRESFINLNGQWEFSLCHPHYDQTITVPFCPECDLSGISQHPEDGQYFWYRRAFALPPFQGRVLLHIGAADQHLTCYVNDREAGTHSGGYENITLDITELVQAENVLEFRCLDDLRDQSQPYGKQTLNRGGMWYTPVSGIWQTVWLEIVPKNHIRKLHIENHGYGVTIAIEPAMGGRVSVPGLGQFPLVGGQVTIQPENPKLWSPEDPYLYDFTLETAEDRVESYFAIRCLESKEVDGIPRLCLNGKPYFFHGLLDQGYWPDGLFTPATPEAYAQDILAMKKLGFNTLRKHIKVEPEEFYYQCDKLGMLVFQDMVNNGQYKFLRDTALPTVGFQKRNDKNFHKDSQVRKTFLDAMTATVHQLKNHPCIVYWTIFNEGWGQFDSDRVYGKLRKLDSTRFIDSTSGWFRRKRTDVESLHIYFGPWSRLKPAKKPLVLSEFGGHTYGVEGHLFNPDKAYGYKTCKTLDDYQASVETLYRQRILPMIPKGLCGAIYTQVSDVEDEINGVLTYDRQVCKLEEETMQTLAQDLQIAIK
ncbi:MAG: glycoside hydrolase family 2 [Oscillospiraceae bacterium]|nr:glycoside hydrolase family 2 [Oscillospiraceae bacterium]